MEKQKRKPYVVAVVLVILYVAEIFWLSGVLGNRLGIAGTVLHEIILALLGIVVFLVMRGKMKKIFPFKRPQFAKLAGTIVLWLGAYIGTMTITMLIAYFFPEEVMGAGQDVQGLIMEMPVILSIFVVAVIPAICEEIAFRGALLSCFRGIKNRWIGIVIVAIVFGACHGSVWRMVPTMLLGVAMGYLLFETENMIYPMLFHFINNAVPVILLAILGGFMNLMDAGSMMDTTTTAVSTELPFATVAIYIMYGGIAPPLIYVGNYLLHRGQPGYNNGLFPREKKKMLITFISISLGMMVLGAVLMGVSLILDPTFYIY